MKKIYENKENVAEKQELFIFHEELEESKKRKKRKRLRIVLIIVLIAAVAGIIGCFLFLNNPDPNTFAQGVSVLGLDVSGKTMNEADAFIKQKIQDEYLNNSITYLIGEKEFVISAQKVGVKAEYQDSLTQAYNYDKSGNVIENLNNRYQAKINGAQFDSVTVDVDNDEIKQVIQNQSKEYLETKPDSNVKLAKKSDSKMKTTDFTVSFESGQGATVDLDKLVDDISQEFKQGINNPVDAEFIKSTAAASEEELSNNFKLRGGYSTQINYPDLPSAYNMWKASDLVNTATIKPGDTWSLKKAIGGLTEDKGWQNALELIGEDQITVPGGGINQFASTVYAAALTAEMEIVKVEHRAWPADYIPAGLDADLATNDNDLQIKNNLGEPVYLIIKCDVPGGKLTAEFYGPDSDAYTRQLTTAAVATQAAGEPQTVQNNALQPGTTNIKREKHDGSTVKISLEYRDSNGQTVKTTDIGSVEYQPYNEIIEENKAAA